MTMTTKWHVMKSYTVVEVHEVEAVDEDAALEKVREGKEDYFLKSFDGDYDNEITVEAV